MRLRLLAVLAVIALFSALGTAEAQASPQTAGVAVGERVMLIDSHRTICYRWRPHSGDVVETSFYYHMDLFVVRVQCVADDPNYTGDHYYCVYVYSSGYESWYPGCIAGFG